MTFVWELIGKVANMYFVCILFVFVLYLFCVVFVFVLHLQFVPSGGMYFFVFVLYFCIFPKRQFYDIFVGINSIFRKHRSSED